MLGGQGRADEAPLYLRETKVWEVAQDKGLVKSNVEWLTPVAETEPDGDPNAELDELLSRPGGLIGVIREYLLATAIRHSPIISGAGALGAMGALSGRKWIVDIGEALSAPAIRCLILATTGAGKEALDHFYNELDTPLPPSRE